MSQKEMMDEIQIQIDQEIEELTPCLEKAKLMGSNQELLKYQNFWCRNISYLKDILHFQKHFKAQDSDIIILSKPKNGTTWLKSLLFSVINRGNPDHQPLHKNSPLLSHNPHELVYFLEQGIYSRNAHHSLPSPQQLQELPSPRLLQTHLPYASLPETIRTSSCKIVYIARNPMDTFVSLWHWNVTLLKNSGVDLESQPQSIEDFFDDFCLGKFPFGPYFDHVVEYWKLSLQQPNKVLFLKYEDLKSKHAYLHLKKLAEFVGFPFSIQEQNEGIMHDIMQLCSFNTLKDLEINKTGSMHKIIENRNLFRKGEVGDWTNYFTPSMLERINMLSQQHFGDTSLSFQMQ